MTNYEKMIHEISNMKPEEYIKEYGTKCVTCIYNSDGDDCLSDEKKTCDIGNIKYFKVRNKK